MASLSSTSVGRRLFAEIIVSGEERENMLHRIKTGNGFLLLVFVSDSFVSFITIIIINDVTVDLSGFIFK